MTGGGAQRWPDYANRTKRTADEQTDMYSLLRVTPYSPTRINTPVLGTTSAAPEIGAGVSYLKTAGGSMIGPIAYYPALDTIASGRISVQQNAGAYSSYVLVNGAGTPDDLNWIDYTSFSGQIIFLQGTNQQVINVISAKCPDISNITGNGSTVTVTTSANHNLVTGQQVNIVQTTNYNIEGVTITVTGGTTFTYSDTTSDPAETSGVVVDGNIITDDGNDIVMDGTVTTKGVPVLKLIFDSTAPNGGTYRVVGGSGGTAGANKTLSNLDNPTSINQALIPDGNGTRDLGSALNSWDSLWSRYIRFDDDVTAPSVGQSHKISTSTLGMDFNVAASGDKFTFYFDGSSEFDIDSAGISVNNSIIVGDGTSGQGFININDSTNMVGAVNGYIYREGNDIKAFSGGVERNLSDIGSGGANTALSNLIATSINQSLNPNGPGSLDLGSDTNYWDQVKAQELKILGSKADPAGTSTEISRDAAGDMNFGVDLITNDFSFFINGVRRARLSEQGTQGLFDVDILEANSQFVLQNSGGDPAVTGVFKTNGSDVKVYSGGAVRNFSDIGGGGQTPWTSNIDADNFLLQDAQAIEFRNANQTSLAAGTPYIHFDDPNMIFNVPTNDGFVWYVQGAVQFGVGGTTNNSYNELNMQGNKVVNGADPTVGSDFATKNYVDTNAVSRGTPFGEYQDTSSATNNNYEFWYSNQINSFGTVTDLAQTEDRQFFFPMWIQKTFTVKRLGLYLTTGAGSTTPKSDFAIYNNLAGQVYPGTVRVASTGNLMVNAGWSVGDIADQTLDPGLYWVSFMCNENNATYRMAGCAAREMIPLGQEDADNPVTVGPTVGYYQTETGTFGTAPDDLSKITGSTPGIVPIIYFSGHA